MTKAEEKARKMIEKQSDIELVKQFELTALSNDPYIPIVRGWLMDEIEKRFPEAFDKWLDEDAEDESLKNYIFS